jgi:hypothetical protein
LPRLRLLLLSCGWLGWLALCGLQQQQQQQQQQQSNAVMVTALLEM